MVKLRCAKYCNLKLFLMFLVIYGHLIEQCISNSKAALFQYKIIYFIHMPLFVFLSGLFIKNADDCKNQIKRILPLYAILQISIVLVSNGKVQLITPYWHLWYLFSLCTWLCLAFIWFKLLKSKGKPILLLCLVVLGCTSGCISFIGREFSLSRTIVFSPYFFAGLMMKPSFPWKKLRIIAVIAFLNSVVLTVIFWNIIPTDFLHHATAYQDVKTGVLLRLVCYFIGCGTGLFILSFIPDRRFLFTKIGSDTLFLYLFHAPIVLLVRKICFSWQYNIIITVIILLLVYNITLWKSKMYGIKSMERGGVGCHHSK